MSLEESAWLDGASRIRTFFSIVLPLCKPGIAATAVLSFCFSWNEFMYAMNLTSTGAKTLPLAMMTYMGESGNEWQMMATAGIVILLPTIVFTVLIPLKSRAPACPLDRSKSSAIPVKAS